MQIFFRLIVCFLGVILLLAAGTVDVHAQNAVLTISGDIGPDKVYQVGQAVEAIFTASDENRDPIEGVTLTITFSGLRDLTISNGGMTDAFGAVIVTGTIASDTGVYIQAVWPDEGLTARGDFNVADTPVSLEVHDRIGGDWSYAVGETVTVTFVARRGELLAAGEKLTITHNGLTGVTISNGGTTNAVGTVIITGTMAKDDAYIEAVWTANQLQARAELSTYEQVVPALIVVSPPDPKSSLIVGDTFTQTIEVQNATDLAGWQMDIAFNPEVLEVVDISEGDFLEGDGRGALFLDEQHPGEISVKQVRVEPVSGVSGSGVLVELRFRLVAFSEALLGIHNVRLSDSSGERLSYSVTLTPVVATHTSAAVEDINQDGQVNILDLVVVAGSIGAAQPNLRADVNDDGIVDILDIVAIADSPHWGKSVGFVQVREPNAPAPAEEVSGDIGF